jgi:hypothetical protein
MSASNADLFDLIAGSACHESVFNILLSGMKTEKAQKALLLIAKMHQRVKFLTGKG